MTMDRRNERFGGGYARGFAEPANLVLRSSQSVAAGLGYQTLSTANEPQEFFRQTKTWPRDKKGMVDSLLLAYGVPFGVAEIFL
jgi:hypothetical protein